MKIRKGILTGLFWLLIIALLVAPLGLIYQISQKEMDAYAAPTAPPLRESAYGKVAQAQRQNVSEYVSVGGSFASSYYAYMELDHDSPGSIRLTVSTGDEIQEGQVIGTCQGEDVVSTLTGILVEMNTYSSDPYLRFRLLSPLELSCRVDDRTLSMLRRSEDLTTSDGDPVTLTYASLQKNPDGSTNIRLSIETEKYTYGQDLSGLQILTGRVFQGVVVLPENCVYQKEPGADSPWYVRQVTEDGYFITELQVDVGYSNGEIVTVSGVPEGTFYDTGYKTILGG